MCVYTGGWAHRQWVNTTFLTWENSQIFVVLLTGMGFKPLVFESQIQRWATLSPWGHIHDCRVGCPWCPCSQGISEQGVDCFAAENVPFLLLLSVVNRKIDPKAAFSCALSHNVPSTRSIVLLRCSLVLVESIRKETEVQICQLCYLRS